MEPKLTLHEDLNQSQIGDQSNTTERPENVQIQQTSIHNVSQIGGQFVSQILGKKRDILPHGDLSRQNLNQSNTMSEFHQLGHQDQNQMFQQHKSFDRLDSFVGDAKNKQNSSVQLLMPTNQSLQNQTNLFDQQEESKFILPPGLGRWQLESDVSETNQ